MLQVAQGAAEAWSGQTFGRNAGCGETLRIESIDAAVECAQPLGSGKSPIQDTISQRLLPIHTSIPTQQQTAGPFLGSRQNMQALTGGRLMLRLHPTQLALVNFAVPWAALLRVWHDVLFNWRSACAAPASNSDGSC